MLTPLTNLDSLDSNRDRHPENPRSRPRKRVKAREKEKGLNTVPTKCSWVLEPSVPYWPIRWTMSSVRLQGVTTLLVPEPKSPSQTTSPRCPCEHPESTVASTSRFPASPSRNHPGQRRLFVWVSVFPFTSLSLHLNNFGYLVI